MAIRSLHAHLSRRLKPESRILFPRPFSSNPSTTANNVEDQFEEEENDLRSRIFRLRLPKRSATTVLEKWVGEGNKVTVSELRNIAKGLRKSQRYKHALEGQCEDESVESKSDTGVPLEKDFGKHVSKKDKVKFLVNTLMDLKDSKEAVYGALDAWVAWEERFPIASLRIALTTLEKEQEWHKVIQVIKWILSKGQGNTMGIYRQLINALDMDHRAEEAHNFWMKRIGSDLHPVPWQLCTLMISIYYRNNMLERLVKLFKGLEAFDRKPPDKAVVQKVANAYELLGLVEEKDRVLEKYNSLFTETWRGHPKNSKKALKKEKISGKQSRASHSEQGNTCDTQMASSDQKITKDDVQVTLCGQQSNMDGMINGVRQMIKTRLPKTG